MAEELTAQNPEPPPAEVETAEVPVRPAKAKKRVAIRYPIRKSIGLTPTDTMAAAGRKILGFHFARMLHEEPATRQGKDMEALHAMRVATRRMRTALQVFGRAFSKKKIKPLRTGLKTTGRKLGRVRDLDVFIERLQSYQQSLPEPEQDGLQPLLHTWQTERKQARQDLLAYLNSNRYREFKQTFLEFVKTEGLGARSIPAGMAVPSQLRHIVPGLVYARYEAVRAYETVLDSASLEMLHQLRIALKELRYILEYFREILGPECEMVIDEVKTLQDHLGCLNDANVASGFLNDFLSNWEEGQLHLPLAERQNPAQLAVYLNSRLDERHHFAVTFPQAWEHFNRPELRRNLALAVAAL